MTSIPRNHGGLGYSPVPSKPLDPTPFVYEYPSGLEEHLHHSPMLSRVGWRFSPRPEYEQDVRYYDAETRKYA